MNKITISTPVFYKESFGKPLYQLLAYDAHNDVWYVQDVVRGCEAPVLSNIDITQVSTDVEIFTKVQPESKIIKNTWTTADTITYLNSLGIPASDKLSKTIEERLTTGYNPVVDFSNFSLDTSQIGKLDLSVAK